MLEEKTFKLRKGKLSITTQNWDEELSDEKD